MPLLRHCCKHIHNAAAVHAQLLLPVLLLLLLCSWCWLAHGLLPPMKALGSCWHRPAEVMPAAVPPDAVAAAPAAASHRAMLAASTAVRSDSS
jgi:hypothetical protein